MMILKYLYIFNTNHIIDFPSPLHLCKITSYIGVALEVLGNLKIVNKCRKIERKSE